MLYSLENIKQNMNSNIVGTDRDLSNRAGTKSFLNNNPDKNSTAQKGQVATCPYENTIKTSQV